MNPKVQNVKNLFANSRTRTIILLTAVVLFIGLLVGAVHLLRQSSAGGSDTAAQLGSTPNIQSVPGGGDQPASDSYKRLVEQANEQQAQVAAERGGSAIPTIVDTNQIGQTQAQPPTACCNACCTASSNGKNVPPLQASSLTTGTLVYDAQGHVIGNVGADGKVRDAEGHVIGSVGPDGIVRDANNRVIGSAGAASKDAPVYDNAGNIIGKVGADGKVRDAQGNVIGTVGPDGVVHDLKGAVLGKVGTAVAGNPVYDTHGNLIGTVGPDGLVRDASGNIVGKVAPDGTVLDKNNHPIGRVSEVPVYDSNGKLIGTIGADGQVRDANGHVIGKVEPDGTVRDSKGNIIGKAEPLVTAGKHSGNVPGAPVYDKQGRLIGTVGPDGRVRDIHGKVIGSVKADGTVVDEDGSPIGTVGPTAPGAPVYDKQGRMIGTVGADGIVRDAQGRAIGQLGADGTVRDLQNNVIGSTTAPAEPTVNAAAQTTGAASNDAFANLTPGAAPSGNTAMQALIDQQAEQISIQKADQLQQQMQGAMATQATQLFTAWAAPQQQYVVGIPPIAQQNGLADSGRTMNRGSASGASGASGSTPAVPITPTVKAGTILYATLLSEVNSDAPGPILAEIVDGKFKGGRLIGKLTVQGQKVLIQFQTLSLANYPSGISINVVAIDQNTAQTALSSYTNNHYILRYGTLFASAFLEGYANAIMTSGQTVVTNGLAVDTQHPDLNARGKFMVALGNVGSQYASNMSSVFATPPTVHVYSGTPIGLLFLDDLVIPSLQSN